MKIKSRSKPSRVRKLSRKTREKKGRTKGKPKRKPRTAKTKKKKKTTLKKKVRPRRTLKLKTMKKRPKQEKKVKIDKLELEKIKHIHSLLSDSFVRQTLIDIGGENALAIIRNFRGKLSDEELAKALKLKISDVRATLNRLHNEGFVKYIRQKDSETGWYSYSWVLNHERLEKWANEQSRGMITLEGNGNQYYFCKACGVTTLTDFLTASDLDFRCERCNKALEFLDEKAVAEFNIFFKEEENKKIGELGSEISKK